MTSARIAAPPRGTRPRNRRELIREAAAALFAERGYARVSLSDVAGAVNVGPSALYRHYSSKAELLYDVVDSALDVSVVSLPTLDDADLPDIAAVMASNVLDNRLAGPLWQRESRNLSPAEQARLGKKVTLVQQWLATKLHTRTPGLELGQAELLAACSLDALTSISFHHLSLPRPEFEVLLTDLCLRVLALEPNRSDPSGGARHRQPPASTRADELIDASIRLFAQHGYPAVSIDDIGAAVGIAGPSVYNHFDSKHDLLVAAMERGHQRLRKDFVDATSAGGSNEAMLRRVTSAYVALTLDHSDLVATLIQETIHLDGPSRERTRLLQRGFIDDWVALLVAHRPEDSAIVARIKVQAAQMVANDIGRTPHLRKVPGFRQTVLDACWAIQQ